MRVGKMENSISPFKSSIIDFEAGGNTRNERIQIIPEPAFMGITNASTVVKTSFIALKCGVRFVYFSAQ